MPTIRRTRSLLLVLATTALLFPAASRAADRVSGEVVDLACYMQHPESGHGAAHRKCADTCLKKGLPMGLLTGDKQLFLLLENHDNPKQYAQLREKAAEQVPVEGTKAASG